MMNIGETREFSLGPGLGSIDPGSLDRLISFHGHLSAGVLIGLQMLVLGRRLLSVEENDRIHVVCETPNCLPDSFQVFTGTTTGNKGLIVRDTGKMAVTITRHTPPGESAPGVRIILDARKTEKFDRLHAWYMNTKKLTHEEVIQILKEAGDTVYSYQYVEVPVTGKIDKGVLTCGICGEPFIQVEKGDSCCIDCVRAKEKMSKPITTPSRNNLSHAPGS